MLRALTAPKIYKVFSLSFSKMVGNRRTYVDVSVPVHEVCEVITSHVLTHQPLPIDQPTTPQALPLARTWRGKISAGYNHGTVSHVAPKIAV